jgi:hypothetical protein
MNETIRPDVDLNDQDAALARRLARLGDKPVSTERLEARLNAAIASIEGELAAADQSDTSSKYRFSHYLRPALGLAAMIALVVTLLFMFTNSPTTASAAVVDLAQLHHDVEAGRYALPTASSMADVNRILAEQRSGRVPLPESMQGVRVQSCCLRDVQGDLIAVVLLKESVDQPAVSLVLAQAPTFAYEMGESIEIQGRTYFGHDLNGIRMMMANTDDRWLCVMGDRSDEALAEIAASAKF